MTVRGLSTKPADPSQILYLSHMKNNATQMSQETSAKIYRNLFTEDEWDTIFAALSDYQDYGSEEAEQSRSAQNKIRKIFELTENN